MKTDRYLKFMNWLWNRYKENGSVTVERGGIPTRYQRLSDAAWKKFMGYKPNFI